MNRFKWWKPKLEREQKDTETECQEKTSLIGEEEMSKLDPILPRYYNGYDIDVLMRKMNDNQPLTKEEAAAYDQASDTYYKREFAHREERWQKRMEEAKKDNKNPFRFGHQVHYSSVGDFPGVQEKGGDDV